VIGCPLCGQTRHWQNLSPPVLNGIPKTVVDQEGLGLSRRTKKLRFFFDWSAGGCLWAGDDETLQILGYGPVDCDSFDIDGKVSQESSLALPKQIKALIATMDVEHATALNPHYQPDPSLWRQEQCDAFNTKIDKLLKLLTEELGREYLIIDKQWRFFEDPELDRYLKDPLGFTRD
jgi:hypothetical protein